MMAVNLRGTWLASRAVVPHMRAAATARSSTSAGHGLEGLGEPHSLRHLEGGGAWLHAHARRELGKDGICVNCVAPASTLSEENPSEGVVKMRAAAAEERAIRRVQKPEDLSARWCSSPRRKATSSPADPGRRRRRMHALTVNRPRADPPDHRAPVGVFAPDHFRELSRAGDLRHCPLRDVDLAQASARNRLPTSEFSRDTMSAGRRAGPTTPIHAVASKTGKPDSASVGTSGMSAMRFALATASTFTFRLALRKSGIDDVELVVDVAASSAAMAGAPP